MEEGPPPPPSPQPRERPGWETARGEALDPGGAMTRPPRPMKAGGAEAGLGADALLPLRLLLMAMLPKSCVELLRQSERGVG